MRKNQSSAHKSASIALPCVFVYNSTIAGSSNGRTDDFDSSNRGSNPCPETNLNAGIIQW